MNKKYGIGFLLGFIILVVLFVLAYRMSYNHSLEKYKSQQELQAKKQAERENCYYIKASNGYVTVYEADQRTVYEYTTIVVEQLPEDLQERLKNGIKVTSLGQVYGFLENYSS